MTTRSFRTPESHYAERVSRDMIEGFLAARGFTSIQDERKKHGNVESQTIHATSPAGVSMVMRVRLCWRRRNPNDTMSAAQILPEIKDNDWEGTLHHKADNERSQGVTHTLFIQRENGTEVSHAALVPLSELVSIWCKQRDVSETLIAAGKLGRRKKNHSMNGASPTIWLYDEKAPEVNDALWKHPGVVDLLKYEPVHPATSKEGDTFDDLPGMDYSLLGSDGGTVVTRAQSYVKRDPRVRREVIKRAEGKCENDACGTSRVFQGFLDVHHILGVEKSDRVWNCVALCPNCHREAHASPEQDAMNARLLSYVMQFQTPHEGG